MRRHASRLLLVLLVVAAIAVGVRLASGPDVPEGFVVFGPHLAMNELYHEAFALKQPTDIVVRGTGSFAWDTEEAAPLAAYGWLVQRHATGTRVVWKMTPENTRHRGATLAQAADTLRLEPGVYDVFFTTFGNPEAVDPELNFFERTARYFDPAYQRWHNDAEHWVFQLAPLSDAGYAALDHGRDDLAFGEGDRPSGLLWQAAPLVNEVRETFLFQVHQPAELHVTALGDTGDRALLTRYPEGDTVWTMTGATTVPAGGSSRNLRFEGVVPLAPGLYRAIAETDGEHAFGNWEANPPDDPHGWGLRLHTRDGQQRITAFDPWGRLPQVVELTQIGNRQLRSRTFAVERELPVVVHLLTEGNDERLYDYGWITSRSTGEAIWDARQIRTQSVEGRDHYQQALSFLTLPPGQYTAYFQSDDRISYGDFRDEPPPHAERWGLAVFSLDPAYQPAAAVADVPASAAALVQLNEIGDDRNATADFNLDAQTLLRIYAVGEMMPGDAYDYGWIERADTGEKVWEMTWGNTQPAGGASKNRKFDGTVTLPAGAYRVHFVSDDSHAFGTFNDTPPDDPAAWGITITRAEETTEVPAAPNAPPLRNR